MTGSAVDLADALLVAASRRNAGAISLTPAGQTHAVSIEEAQGTMSILSLPGDLGDAIVARLAILAKLDVMAPEQLGRIRVRTGKAPGWTDTQVLVSIYAAVDGLSVELRRVPTAEDARIAAPGSRPAAVDDDGRGGTLVGPYRVFEELGYGGTGVVYRAEHQALGKEVALKVLYADIARDPVVASRFIREARAASRVRHPGIVDVTDFGSLPDGRAYLVMELVHGKTLETLLEKGPFEPGRALAVVRQIALALDAAHRAGVMHRDLKPANVFITAEPLDEPPQIKIADFGAAKLVDPGQPPSLADSQSGQIFGTPQYMSPEHAGGRPTDRRTDLYALGCVLFELISGKCPFSGETSVEILTKHITERVPPLTSPYGPVDVIEEVVTRALAKKVDQRYQTASEMASDLERAIAALGRAGWRRWLPL